eukprot:5089516-Lingulodinium_polyedra.AAC.1
MCIRDSVRTAPARAHIVAHRPAGAGSAGGAAPPDAWSARAGARRGVALPAGCRWSRLLPHAARASWPVSGGQ